MIREINIKGMVCSRCIFTIKKSFQSLGFTISNIYLGKVIFHAPVDTREKEQLRQILAELGFELIADKNEQLLAAIKTAIDERINTEAYTEDRVKLSEYLTQKFSRSYGTLSEFFTRYEGKTIEKYFIGKRIEKVKEFLVYSDLSLSEIAFRMGFSSAYHLSGQFRKITGFNPSHLRLNRARQTSTAAE